MSSIDPPVALVAVTSTRCGRCAVRSPRLIKVDAATTVSFWVYYPQPELPQPLTSAHLGRLLADLHAIPPPPRDLPRWVPLDSLDHALQDDTVAVVLTDTDRDWLHRRVGEVRDELATLDWPLGHGLIHGDAWVGNLLQAPTTHSPDGIVLGDWDRVAHGPREVDLIPTWHAARRYGKGPGWTRDFTDRSAAQPIHHPTPARCVNESLDSARATPPPSGRHSDRLLCRLQRHP